MAALCIFIVARVSDLDLKGSRLASVLQNTILKNGILFPILTC
jgi:hypothetical protein